MISTLEKKAFLFLLLGLTTIYSSAGGQKGLGGGSHLLLIWAISWQTSK